MNKIEKLLTNLQKDEDNQNIPEVIYDECSDCLSINWIGFIPNDNVFYFVNKNFSFICNKKNDFEIVGFKIDGFKKLFSSTELSLPIVTDEELKERIDSIKNKKAIYFTLDEVKDKTRKIINENVNISNLQQAVSKYVKLLIELKYTDNDIDYNNEEILNLIENNGTKLNFIAIGKLEEEFKTPILMTDEQFQHKFINDENYRNDLLKRTNINLNYQRVIKEYGNN